MKQFKYITAVLAIAFCSASWAQQETIITQFTEQMNIINPAYAGADNKTVIASSIRSQWTGIAEAPEMQLVNFSTGLGKNVGIGVSMVREKTFIEKQNFVTIDFSYKLKVSEHTDLYFGIKAGGNFYDVNVNGLETYNIVSDPALVNINQFSPNIGTGVYLKRKKWFMSLSVPRMLNTERTRNDNGIATVATDRPHFYAATGYDFTLNDKGNLFLQPAILMRYVNGAPVSVDINTMLSFNNTFKIGGTYRTDQAYAALMNVELSKRFVLGFAFEKSTRPELARARNTNEILLKFNF